MQTASESEAVENWDGLGLRTEILRGIYAYGFEKPSPIQGRAIGPILKGRDVIAQAQSGTGKTGCFAIAALSMADPGKRHAQVLVLSPTRELTQQTNKVASSLGQFVEGIKMQTLVGGSSVRGDADTIRRDRPQILLGCPGRVNDLIKRGSLGVGKLKLLILDEADEMLSSGFREQVFSIFQSLPDEVQVALFSATMPTEMEVVTQKFMRSPEKILVKAEQLTLEGIEQFYVPVGTDDDKIECIKDLFGEMVVAQTIIYCNSVSRVDRLHQCLETEGFPVGSIHGMMSKEEREKSYKDFQKGETRVLISTNLTARGIDVQQVSTVINFDLPRCVHAYLHRIGRSGRWGRKGVGINLVTRRDVGSMREIERHYETQIDEMPADWAKHSTR